MAPDTMSNRLYLRNRLYQPYHLNRVDIVEPGLLTLQRLSKALTARGTMVRARTSTLAVSLRLNPHRPGHSFSLYLYRFLFFTALLGYYKPETKRLANVA